MRNILSNKSLKIKNQDKFKILLNFKLNTIYITPKIIFK